MANKTNKSKRNVGQRAKNFVSEQTKAASSAANMLGSAGELVNGIKNVTTSKSVSGKLKGAVKAAKGGVNVVSNAVAAMYHSGKSIFNPRSDYEKNGKVTPAANYNRPMNPSMIKQITNDPTMGSVIKVVDIYASWLGFNDSEAFDLIVFEYYQAIRQSLRSNLPYTQNFLKSYLINAINTHAICMSIKKLLQFRSVAIKDLPKGYQLFRSTAQNFDGYGLNSLAEIEWLNDDVIPQNIAIYEIVADVHNKLMLLPKPLSDWIDHYFGLVYTMDDDPYNVQYLNPILTKFELANYNAETDSVTTDLISFQSINPQYALNLITDFSQKYGMITADILKSQSGLVSIKLPKFSEMTAEVYYDPTYIQAIINAYTSNDAVTEDGYVRLDLFTHNGNILDDDLTTYLFLGSLQDQSTNDAMYLPLIKVSGMCAKFVNDPALQWDRGFTQGLVDFTNYPLLGLSIQTRVDADYYINAVNSENYATLQFYGPQTYNGTNNVTGFICYGSFSKATGLSAARLINADNINLSLYSTTSGYAYYPIMWFYNGTSRVFGCIEFTFTSKPFSIASVNVDFEPTGRYVVLDQSKINIYGNNANTTFAGIHMFKTIQDNVANYTLAGPTILQTLGYLTVNLNNINSYNGATKKTLESFTLAWVQVNAGQTIFTGSDFVLTPDSQYTFDITNGNIFSFTSILGETTGAEEQITDNSGYLGLVAYFVDQVDHHLPIVHYINNNVKYSSETDYIKSNIAKDLVKESYVPYFYQIFDLLPVAYQMLTSLFKPVNTRSTDIR